VLSLYFFNKDGHSGKNVFRDFAIEVRETPACAGILGGSPLKRNPQAEKHFNSQPLLAFSRVRDFWNPVYKRFLVRGPGVYTVRVSRNGSFNSIISGLFLDPVEKLRQPEARLVQVAQTASPTVEASSAIHQKLLQLQRNPVWFASSSRPYWIALASEFRREAFEEGRFGNADFRRRLSDSLDALCLFGLRDNLHDRTKERKYYLWRLWDGKTRYGKDWPNGAEQSRELRFGFTTVSQQ
jgi:hypothetical protein